MNDDMYMVTGGKDTQKISGSIAVDTTGLATSAKQDDIITAINNIPGGGGIQYTEGDIDTTITGTAMLGEGASNTLAPIQLDASNNIKVAVQGTVPVSGTFFQATQPVSIAAPIAVTQSGTWDEVGINDSGNSITVDDGGLSLTVDGTVAATQSGTWVLGANSGVDIGDVTINNGVGAAAVNIQDGGNTITVDGTVGISGSVTVQDGGGSLTVDNNGTFATQAAQSGTWTVQPGNTANTTPWLVAQQTYSTSSVTSVAASATSVQILASTSGRKGAYFYNDSTAICYLKLGTTASTTSFTVAIPGSGFYELPHPCYTGRIDAVWASATGNLRVTEIT